MAAPTTNPLDPEVVASLVALGDEGGENILKLLMDIFTGEEAPGCLVRMEDAVQAADAAELAEGAHKLKGSAAQLGAARLRELCATLEGDARDGQLARAAALVAEIRAEVDRVSSALEHEVASLKA